MIMVTPCRYYTIIISLLGKWKEKDLVVSFWCMQQADVLVPSLLWSKGSIEIVIDCARGAWMVTMSNMRLLRLSLARAVVIFHFTKHLINAHSLNQCWSIEYDEKVTTYPSSTHNDSVDRPPVKWIWTASRVRSGECFMCGELLGTQSGIVKIFLSIFFCKTDNT